MKAPERVLIFVSFFDEIIVSWLTVWWVKIFSTSITNSALSMNGILESILGVVCVFLIIKKFENPDPMVVLLANMCVYVSLLGLLISPEIFLMVSTVLGSFAVAFNRVLQTSLIAQNVSPRKRNMFDNREYLCSAVGGVIGGTIALFTVSEHFSVSYMIIWSIVFILGDIGTWTKILLIKNKTFTYTTDFNSRKSS